MEGSATKVICLLLAAALATACQTHYSSPVGGGDGGGDDGQDPRDQKTLTTKGIQRHLENNGKRVFVVFSEFKAAGKIHACPVKVRTVDSVCASQAFQNSDPSVVCRAARGASNNASLNQIEWRSELGDRPNARVNFRVVFDNNFMPCSQSWTGDKLAGSHTCDLRDKAGLEIGGAGRVYVKYTIVGDDPACPPLDPYFIVRH